VTVENSKVKDLCRKLICVVIAVLAPDQHDPTGLLKMDCDDRVGRSDLGPSVVPRCVRERSLYLLETIRQGRLALRSGTLISASEE